ncbi:TAR DNA-binding protein 43-like [Planococcus citri]|uniref:TAR DNA-binding protein 43-like n=1 Tax=Planococcus citri TaxID=170843 RepID=UPI0031F97A45
MSSNYVRVSEDTGEEPIELPVEQDDTLLLSTVSAQFPCVSGLKYAVENYYRGVKLCEGRLYPPDGYWGKTVYYCVFPKENKRKCNDSPSNFQIKTKRFEANSSIDLIVLGLPWQLTEIQLREYFQTYGSVKMAMIKRDQVTGRSKGFGFIRFDHYDSQVKVLSKRHFISGRWCDVKIPDSKEGSDVHIPCKIFVGRISENLTVDDLRAYFSQFGEVTDVYIPKPFRSFAFVTFDSPDTAQHLIGEDHVIKGVSVHVSEASPRYSNSRTQRQRNPFWQSTKSTNKHQPPVDSNAVALLSAIAGNPSVLAAVNQMGLNCNKMPANNPRNQKCEQYGYAEPSHFMYQ